MDLEQELRQTLARKRAPAGFADRVMEKTRTQARTRTVPWRWAVAAAVLVCLGGGWWKVDQAGRELESALRIASSKIDLAEKKASEVFVR